MAWGPKVERHSKPSGLTISPHCQPTAKQDPTYLYSGESSPHHGPRRKMDDQIQELQTPQNTYISMLPEDLLVDIFLRVQADAQELCDWHYIAHICQDWRHTALNAAILWTEPPANASLEYTKLMLDRSKGAALTVDLDAELASPDTILAVSNHIERIQDLRLAFAAWDSNDPTFSPLLSLGRKFLHLESLYIGDATWTPVFEEFLSQIPSLQSLSLVDITGNWQLPPLGRLISLKISFQHCEEAASIQTLLQALEGLIHLQRFHLGFDFNTIPGSAPITQATAVCLPQLRQLYVSSVHENGAPHILGLLSNLELPELDECDIRVNARERTEDDQSLASKILDAVATILSNGNFHPELGGSFWVQDDTIRILREGKRVVHFTLSVCAPYTFLPTKCTRLLAIFPRINLLNLVTLGLDSDSFGQVFGNLPALKTIVIGYFRDLVSMLTRALARRSCPNSPCVAHFKFPALDTIGCLGIRWILDLEIIEDFGHVLLQRPQLGYATAIEAVYWQLAKNIGRPPEKLIELLRDGGLEVEEREIVHNFRF